MNALDLNSSAIAKIIRFCMVTKRNTRIHGMMEKAKSYSGRSSGIRIGFWAIFDNAMRTVPARYAVIQETGNAIPSPPEMREQTEIPCEGKPKKREREHGASGNPTANEVRKSGKLSSCVTKQDSHCSTVLRNESSDLLSSAVPTTYGPVVVVKVYGISGGRPAGSLSRAHLR